LKSFRSLVVQVAPTFLGLVIVYPVLLAVRPLRRVWPPLLVNVLGVYLAVTLYAIAVWIVGYFLFTVGGPKPPHRAPTDPGPTRNTAGLPQVTADRRLPEPPLPPWAIPEEHHDWSTTMTPEPLARDLVPNAARIYDFLLGGSSNFATDRRPAKRLIAAVPEIRIAAHANRAFLRRAVAYALTEGIDQFLDLGSGLPTVGNIHEIVAQNGNPDARVVYVDIDPVVVIHAWTLVDPTRVGVVQADLSDPAAVLSDPIVRRLIDITQPVAVLAVAALHFVPGDGATVVAGYRQAMAPGSLLVLSHGTIHPHAAG